MRAIYVACGALSLLMLIGALRHVASTPAATGSAVHPWHLSQTGGVPATLVLYIFSNTDPEYIHNLEYFAQHGAKENDGCEYIFIIQKDKDKEVRIRERERRPSAGSPAEVADGAQGA